jgi:hypothetical protein
MKILKSRKAQLFVLILSLVALSRANCPAQAVPSLINYQGRLTDASVNPLPNGTYGVAFRIWSKKSISDPGNQLIWGQEYEVAVLNGAFNVILGGPGVPLSGAQTNNLEAAFKGPERYLGLTLTRTANGTPIANPQEIVPRQQILSAPYAVSAMYSAEALTSDYSSRSGNADYAAHALVAEQTLSSPGADRVGLVIENSPANPSKAISLTASLLNVQGVSRENLNLTVNLALNGANGLDTGTAFPSRWYYVWVVHNSATNSTVGLFSASATTPVLPAGYAKHRMVGTIRTDTNTNIIRFSQIDTLVLFDELIAKATSTGNEWTDLDLSDVVPPLARLAHINAMNSAGMAPSLGNVEMRARSKGSSSTFGSFYSRGRGGAQTTTGCVVTDRNQVIQYKVSTEGAGGTFILYVAGYTVGL